MIVIYNTFHCGDALLSRPIITTIRDTFKNLNIILCFNKSLHYLFKDLGLEIREDMILGIPTYNSWFGVYPDFLGTYGLTYKTQIYSFNRQMELQLLPYRLSTQLLKESPTINFPIFNLQIPALPNSIFIENGECRSGQNNLDMNEIIPKLINDFKHIHFYITAKISLQAPNLHDCHDLNLIELSNLSNSCMAFILRGSAACVATYTEQNRGKLRIFYGWNYPYKIWDNNYINCRTYNEIHSLIIKHKL